MYVCETVVLFQYLVFSVVSRNSRGTGYTVSGVIQTSGNLLTEQKNCMYITH